MCLVRQTVAESSRSAGTGAGIERKKEVGPTLPLSKKKKKRGALLSAGLLAKLKVGVSAG